MWSFFTKALQNKDKTASATATNLVIFISQARKKPLGRAIEVNIAYTAPMSNIKNTPRWGVFYIFPAVRQRCET
jgi:hypothetical protein